MRWFIPVFACLLTVSAFAQESAPQPPQLTSKAQVKDFTAQFLKTLATGTTIDAFNQLKAATPDAEADIDATRDRTLGLLDSLRDTYGRPIGYDIVTERALGDSVIKYETLLKMEKFAIRCTIIYYKPHDTWQPARINFDPDLNLMFDELFNNGGRSANRSTTEQP